MTGTRCVFDFSAAHLRKGGPRPRTLLVVFSLYFHLGSPLCLIGVLIEKAQGDRPALIRSAALAGWCVAGQVTGMLAGVWVVGKGRHIGGLGARNFTKPKTNSSQEPSCCDACFLP